MAALLRKTEAYALTGLATGANSPVWSPDGRTIAFLSPSDAAERQREASGESEPPPITKLEKRHQRERQEDAEARRNDLLRATRIPYRDGYGKSFMDGRYQQVYVIAAQAGAQPKRLTDLDADHAALSWSVDGRDLLTFRPAEHLADEPSRFDALYRIRVSDGMAERLTHEAYADRNPVMSPDEAWIATVRTPQEKLYTRVPLLAVIPAGGGAGRDLTLALDRTALDPQWSPDGKLYFRAHSEGNTEIY